MQKYVIALYIRLSIEDYKYDSLSIENQSLVIKCKNSNLICGDSNLMNGYFNELCGLTENLVYKFYY